MNWRARVNRIWWNCWGDRQPENHNHAILAKLNIPRLQSRCIHNHSKRNARHARLQLLIWPRHPARKRAAHRATRNAGLQRHRFIRDDHVAPLRCLSQHPAPRRARPAQPDEHPQPLQNSIFARRRIGAVHPSRPQPRAKPSARRCRDYRQLVAHRRRANRQTLAASQCPHRRARRRAIQLHQPARARNVGHQPRLRLCALCD